MIDNVKLLRRERGSATLISLALIVMLSTIALMAVQNSITEVDISFNDVRYEQAYMLADAGLEKGTVKLNTDLDWRTKFDYAAFGNGSFSLQVLDSSAGVAGGDTIIIRSTASTGGAPKSWVILESWNIPIWSINHYKWAAFGDQSMSIENNACTDSYNSDSGSYAATLAPVLGVRREGERTAEAVVPVGQDRVGLGAAQRYEGFGLGR